VWISSFLVGAEARPTQTFQAFLDGLASVPPNASPATGVRSVVLNDAQTRITVDLSWSGLTAPATAAHIHGPAAPGTNAPVLSPFTGVPAATSGAIPEQVFSITPTQVAQLEAGQYYFNIHTSNFPGGEIRGQIVLPEPATIGALSLCVGALLLRRRERSLRR